MYNRSMWRLFQVCMVGVAFLMTGCSGATIRNVAQEIVRERVVWNYRPYVITQEVIDDPAEKLGASSGGDIFAISGIAPSRGMLALQRSNGKLVLIVDEAELWREKHAVIRHGGPR